MKFDSGETVRDSEKIDFVGTEIDRDSAAMTKNLTEMKSDWTEMIRDGTENDFVGAEISCVGTEITTSF